MIDVGQVLANLPLTTYLYLDRIAGVWTVSGPGLVEGSDRFAVLARGRLTVDCWRANFDAGEWSVAHPDGVRDAHELLTALVEGRVRGWLESA